MRADPRLEQSRDSILRAAEDLFVDGGVPAVTIDAVSSRSGVARSTIYRHFPGRAELLVGMLETFADEFMVADELPDAAADERLRVLMVNLVGRLTDVRWRRVLIACLDASTAGDFAAVRTRMEEHESKLLDRVLRDGIAEGLLPADLDLYEAGMQLFGPVMLTGLTEPAMLTPAFAERIVALFLASRRTVPEGAAHDG